MRVVLLHYSAPPIVGGVESVIGHHARLIAEDGHEVCIVAGRGGQTDARVGFVPVPLADSRHPVVAAAKEQLDRGVIPADFEQRVEELDGLLRPALAGADCLIAHNVCSLNKNLILTAAVKRISVELDQMRVILWHHDLAWTTPRYQAELHDGYPWDLLRTAWPGVVQVTISGYRQQELAGLMNLPAETIRVVPNGVDVTRFLKLETLTYSLVERLDLLRAQPILLLPVRITPRKNIELALHILAEIRRREPRATLIVTGPLGPHNPANLAYFEELKALRASLSLEGNAFFLAELVDTTLPDEVVADFYRLADALLLPSREEGFGIPIVEAGLAGLPIFCADIPPLRDLALEFAEYFSPDGPPAEIASRMLDRLSSSPVTAFRASVRSNYTWGAIYQTQIRSLLRKGK
jgi:glycosyltransferase involved in cell wall biosynthesis